jgi:hypothetical protein
MSSRPFHFDEELRSALDRVSSASPCERALERLDEWEKRKLLDDLEKVAALLDGESVLIPAPGGENAA